MPTRPLSSRVAVEIRRVLHEAVGAPAALRVVADLHDGVGALALLLRQRHDQRVVTTFVPAHARADAPVLVQPIRDVDLVRARGEAECRLAVIRLGAQRDALGDGHLERAAVVLGVRQRLQARRRVAAVQALRVHRQPATAVVRRNRPDRSSRRRDRRRRRRSRTTRRRSPEKPKPPSSERMTLDKKPSVCAPCSLNHESELIRTVTSAASRLLSTSPSSFEFAVRPTLTRSPNQ